MNDLAGLINTVFQEGGADKRFDDVAQNRVLFGTALLGFTVAQQNVL